MRENLNHSGVKGMHWGATNKKARVAPSADARAAAKLKKKPVHSLTNNDLKKLNDRLNLEQNHARLNPSKAARGKKTAETVLKTVGVAGIPGAIKFLGSPAGKSTVSAGKKAAATMFVAGKMSTMRLK